MIWGPWGVLGGSLGGPWGPGGLLGRSWEEFGRQKGSPRTPFGRPIFMFFCYKNVGFYTISVIWEVWGNGRVPLCLPLIFDVFLGRVLRGVLFVFGSVVIVNCFDPTKTYSGKNGVKTFSPIPTF